MWYIYVAVEANRKFWGLNRPVCGEAEFLNQPSSISKLNPPMAIPAYLSLLSRTMEMLFASEAVLEQRIGKFVWFSLWLGYLSMSLIEVSSC